MASVVDVSAILQNAQSADAHARQQAEIQLQQFQQQDHPSYLLSLATELSKEQADAATRQMAGVILKNNVDAPSEARKVRRVLCDYQPVPCLSGILQGAEAHASVSTYTGRTCGALERIATSREGADTPAASEYLGFRGMDRSSECHLCLLRICTRLGGPDVIQFVLYDCCHRFNPDVHACVSLHDPG